jgi:iron complex transport system substrate-binding protein
MAAHQKSLTWALVVVVLATMTGFARSQTRPPAGMPAAPQRIISLIPSVTEMLFAIGAGPRVVGVSSFDTYPPEVQSRTKVGGLIDPDVERILKLRPDLVVVYGTQSDLRTQLERARIPVFLYEHAGLSDVTATIRAIGGRVGARDNAGRLADEIESRIQRVRSRVSGRPRPKTLLVFGRDSESLRGIYASGGVGFLHDMLEAAGGTDVLGDLRRQSVQATSELILARAPEVILEVREGAGVRNLRAWDVLPSVPAVRTRRVYLLAGDEMVTPGPRVAVAIERIATVLHP